LVVDDDDVPLGWIDADGVRRHRAGAPLSESISAVGSQLRPTGNLSQALDAALSSPSFVGVAVDRKGKVVGGVLASDVLTAVEARGQD
jgi:osmoprotectant transport system ATP-binding protein